MANNIVTYTGKIFDLLNPKPEQVCIEDIAHSLAYQCRYTGHTREFYSVAQHCVLMAKNSILPGDPLAKLLHDAGEAYIGDIARPWKRLLYVNMPSMPRTIQVNKHYHSVREFEQKIQDVIGLALGINLEYFAEVKVADIQMMATEIRDLMPVMPEFSVWDIGEYNPVEEIIIPWMSNYAEKAFLKCYNELIED